MLHLTRPHAPHSSEVSRAVSGSPRGGPGQKRWRASNHDAASERERARSVRVRLEPHSLPATCSSSRKTSGSSASTGGSAAATGVNPSVAPSCWPVSLGGVAPPECCCRSVAYSNPRRSLSCSRPFAKRAAEEEMEKQAAEARRQEEGRFKFDHSGAELRRQANS